MGRGGDAMDGYRQNILIDFISKPEIFYFSDYFY